MSTQTQTRKHRVRALKHYYFYDFYVDFFLFDVEGRLAGCS